MPRQNDTQKEWEGGLNMDSSPFRALKCSVKVGADRQGRSITLGEPLLRVFRELMQRVNHDGHGPYRGRAKI